MTIEHFTFPAQTDKSPHQEVVSDAFFYIGFILLVALICAIAGLVWGLLVRFAPGFIDVLQYFFQPTFDFLTR